jgi:hypothetical protein
VTSREAVVGGRDFRRPGVRHTATLSPSTRRRHELRVHHSATSVSTRSRHRPTATERISTGASGRRRGQVPRAPRQMKAAPRNGSPYSTARLRMRSHRAPAARTRTATTRQHSAHPVRAARQPVRRAHVGGHRSRPPMPRSPPPATVRHTRRSAPARPRAFDGKPPARARHAKHAHGR